MAEQKNGLYIEYSPVGNKTRLVVRLGQDVVHVDTLDLGSAQRRDKFVAAIKERVPAIEARDLECELLRVASTHQGMPPASGGPMARPEESKDIPEDVRREAMDMLEDPFLIQRIIDDVDLLGVAGERELVAALYVGGTSRKLKRPLSIIVQGPSSSGKTYVTEKVASLFPPEEVIFATQMTPQALFHMKPGSLKHKFIVAGERSRMEDDERAEATRALREMLGSGRLTKLMPVKVEGGHIETRTIEQEGPIAYVETTTVMKIFEEDANRCLLIPTDEQPDQTKRVIRKLALAYAEQSLGNRDSSERIIGRHHAAQRLLETMPVVIRFVDRLGELFVSDRVEARRAFPHVLAAIEAVTILHQHQRQHDSQGRLIATRVDYEITRRLLDKPMGRLLMGKVSDGAERFHALLLGQWANSPFTSKDAILQSTSSESSVYGWIGELYDAGCLTMVQPSRGRSPAVWQLAPDRQPCGQAASSGLPEPEKVLDESAWTHGHNPQPIVAQ